MVKTNVFRAEERGKSELGWLKARFSFSFANYNNPERMGFGKLRVLNDDCISGGGGFDMHPHENMEIITIIHEGVLEHKDDKGNEGVIGPGEVQVMSAGTGIVHSEFNSSKENDVKLFQIWIEPASMGVEPRYDKKMFDIKNDEFTHLVDGSNGGETLMIHQDATLSIGQFEEGHEVNINVAPDRGTFIIVMKGSLTVEGEILNDRDSIEVSETDCIHTKATAKVRYLKIDIPLR